MNKFLTVLAIVLICIGAISILVVTDNHRKSEIESWATEHGYVFKEARMRHVFEVSPFWLADGDDVIYRAVVIDKDQEKVVWFWFGLFGKEEKWE